MRQRCQLGAVEDEGLANISKSIDCNGMVGMRPMAYGASGAKQSAGKAFEYSFQPGANVDSVVESVGELDARARSMSPQFRSDASRKSSAAVGFLHRVSTVLSQRKHWRQECGNHGSPELLVNVCAILAAASLSPNTAGSSLKCDKAQPVGCRPTGNPLLAGKADGPDVDPGPDAGPAQWA